MKSLSERVILHSDMNCFYASVEMLHHPEFAGMPLAVGGDPEARHGIVLTANYIAKQKGVKTGMALWQAKQICPEIIFVPPRMDLYLRFSKMAREIYSEYTDKIEPYGIDEAWLDVSDSRNLKGSGMTIAREISHRIKYELGVTVSIGISWNKIRFMRNLVQIIKSRMQSQSLIEKIIKTGYGSFQRQIYFMSEDRQIRNCKNLESGQSGNLRNQTKSC